MFEANIRNSLPGYTGHVQSRVEEDAVPREQARKHIPGYGGYIPAIKSENLFGKTYAKATQLSAANKIHRGMDEPPEIKYGSVFKSEFIQHANVQHETTAEIVGVQRQQDTYQRPIPPSTVNKFFGMNHSEQDPLVQQQEFDKSKNSFFAAGASIVHTDKKKEQPLDDATNVFYGIQASNPNNDKLGAPIPGYSGVSRRVQADNVFGMTYAEANRRAKDSQARI